MWNLPGPGIGPRFPVLAGRLLTTGPPGKSRTLVLTQRCWALGNGPALDLDLKGLIRLLRGDLEGAVAEAGRPAWRLLQEARWEVMDQVT